jgi:acetyl esterase/lipase
MKVNGAMANLYFKGKVDKKDPRISPIFAKNLSNLPATLMTVGDQDFLYESSLAFGKKLDAAGTAVKFILYKNANHAFIDDTGNSDLADDFVREAAEFIKN